MRAFPCGHAPRPMLSTPMPSPSGAAVLRGPLCVVRGGRSLVACCSAVQGVAIFTLSRVISDGIATFALRLHPIPYCALLTTPCVAEASAVRQFVYALGLLVVGSALKSAAEEEDGTPRAARDAHGDIVWERSGQPQPLLPGLQNVGPVMGMSVGWCVARERSPTNNDHRGRTHERSPAHKMTPVP